MRVCLHQIARIDHKIALNSLTSKYFIIDNILDDTILPGQHLYDDMMLKIHQKQNVMIFVIVIL